MFDIMKKEYREYKNIEPTYKDMFWFYFNSISFRTLVTLRRMQNYAKKEKNFRALLCRNKLMIKYGFEAGYQTIIGEHLMVPHSNGIVLGRGCIIGDNCKIYQNVTIGRKNNEYPRIGNNVIIYPGAAVLGNINIGNNVVIGANALVISDLPDNAVAAGIPARIIRIGDTETDL